MTRRHEDIEPHLLKPGEYCIWNGIWYCCTPNGHLGNLRQHEVTEHEDGTITVSPSILVSRNRPRDGRWTESEVYHGYLERGVWRSV